MPGRHEANRWIQGLVEDVQSGTLIARESI
jgi:hypothetical protein